jgi:hypothetical protein
MSFKMSKKMKSKNKIAVLVLISSLISAQSSISFADDPSATLRGYTEVNRIIHERIARTNGFELGQYLGDNSSQPSVGKLLALLGTYVGSSTDGDYRNGDPNSVNTLLWYIALSQFAQDITDTCNTPSPSIDPSPLPSSEASVEPSPSVMPSPSPSPTPPLALRPNFRAALLPLCAWPAASAKTDDALYNYWSALMSFDAPPEEFAAWREYFLNEAEYANAPASAALPAMTLAALFNPYFLLNN